MSVRAGFLACVALSTMALVLRRARRTGAGGRARRAHHERELSGLPHRAKHPDAGAGCGGVDEDRGDDGREGREGLERGGARSRRLPGQAPRPGPGRPRQDDSAQHLHDVPRPRPDPARPPVAGRVGRDARSRCSTRARRFPTTPSPSSTNTCPSISASNRPPSLAPFRQRPFGVDRSRGLRNAGKVVYERATKRFQVWRYTSWW